jgi:alkaline phosphatase
MPTRRVLGRASILLLLLLPLLGADRTGPARNAILFVGDGMGVSVVTAARVHGPGPGGRLAMELPSVALVRTFSRDRMVTDSAASATAILAGQKVHSGTLGMSPETRRSCSVEKRPDGSSNPVHPCSEAAKPLASLADLALAAGMAVGVVSTTRITHATPAALYAHIEDRDREEEIAAQLVDRSDFAFVAGGGRRFFLPRFPGRNGGSAGSRTDGRNLLTEFEERGCRVARTGEELRQAVEEEAPRIVALLADDHLPFEIQRRQAGAKAPPDLAELTELAIRQLNRHPGGYLLLVEGGRIDHALHGNAAHVALEETLALDAAVGRARELVSEEETLLVVTGDHGQPLVIAGYSLVEDPILGLARRFEGIERLDEDGDGKPDWARGLDGRGMTVLQFGNGPGHGDAASAQPWKAEREDPIELGDGVLHPRYRQESGIPLSYTTHEGTDVFAAAVGPGSEAVEGFLDNTEIFGILRRALGL